MKRLLRADSTLYGPLVGQLWESNKKKISGAFNDALRILLELPRWISAGWMSEFSHLFEGIEMSKDRLQKKKPRRHKVSRGILVFGNIGKQNELNSHGLLHTVPNTLQVNNH